MFLFWIFLRWKIWYFWAKKLMEIWYLLITEKFLFWSFWEWEIRSFLSQNVDGKIIFTDYWKVLILNFSLIGNTVFFWVKKLMERWYSLVTEKFLFWSFRWWEIRPFLSQKVDGKLIFTWSFWAFHDIPGLGRYSFSRSDKGLIKIIYYFNVQILKTALVSHLFLCFSSNFRC